MADKDSNWDYKPDADDNLETATTRADDFISWSASEYIDHNQGPMWFFMLLVITCAIAALVYLITRDYFATGTILALGIIVGTFAMRKPRQLNYELSPEGLRVGDKLYSLRTFKSFSVIEDGALLSLNFEPVKRFMTPISVYFSPGDHEKIMDVLENRLPYVEQKLDVVERLSRRLRF